MRRRQGLCVWDCVWSNRCLLAEPCMLQMGGFNVSMHITCFFLFSLTLSLLQGARNSIRIRNQSREQTAGLDTFCGAVPLCSCRLPRGPAATPFSSASASDFWSCRRTPIPNSLSLTPHAPHRQFQEGLERGPNFKALGGGAKKRRSAATNPSWGAG